MILKIHKDKINFIQVDIEKDIYSSFIVSGIPENDVDNLYQYFIGIADDSGIYNAVWHYKTGQEIISTTNTFYSSVFRMWNFIFKIPDDETRLYFELKYGS